MKIFWRHGLHIIFDYDNLQPILTVLSGQSGVIVLAPVNLVVNPGTDGVIQTTSRIENTFQTTYNTQNLEQTSQFPQDKKLTKHVSNKGV